MFDIEPEISAIVGIAFSNKVVYNIIEREGDFYYTGMSIINYLKNNKNKYISEIVKSQSYESIKTIYDDKVIFGKYYNNSNSNYDSFEEIYSLMKYDETYQHFYIYDMFSDLLIIKIPEIKNITGLDYKNSEDVRDFLNNIKGK